MTGRTFEQCRIGDTLQTQTEGASLQESRSRPIAGIITFIDRRTNPRGEIVCPCARAAWITRRPACG